MNPVLQDTQTVGLDGVSTPQLSATFKSNMVSCSTKFGGLSRGQSIDQKKYTFMFSMNDALMTEDYDFMLSIIL